VRHFLEQCSRRDGFQRRSRERYGVLVLCAIFGASSLCACGGGEAKPDASDAAKNKPKVRAQVSAAAKADTPESHPVGPPIDFNDATNMRDPFQSYAREFADEAKKRVRSQRDVVLDQYSLDELKLAGLVTGIRPARAMLIDPTKKGTVVTEGQFIGRAEVVQGGTSGADYEINWRVDRIRGDDIVLVREDPSNPDVPSATRVIPLRPDEVVAAR
jgi:Tfp pilus assembly protein PilP